MYMSYRAPGHNRTHNEQRNRQLAEVLFAEHACGIRPLYYIFVDDNLPMLMQDLSWAKAHGIQLDKNVWRSFESFLETWQPALGLTSYQSKPGVHMHNAHCDVTCARSKSRHGCSLVNVGHLTDALLNAFHRNAVRTMLLPYIQFTDVQQWSFSQHIINYLSTMFFNEERVIFLPVQLPPKVAHVSGGKTFGRRCYGTPPKSNPAMMQARLIQFLNASFLDGAAIQPAVEAIARSSSSMVEVRPLIAAPNVRHCLSSAEASSFGIPKNQSDAPSKPFSIPNRDRILDFRHPIWYSHELFWKLFDGTAPMSKDEFLQRWERWTVTMSQLSDHYRSCEPLVN